MPQLPPNTSVTPCNTIGAELYDPVSGALRSSGTEGKFPGSLLGFFVFPPEFPRLDPRSGTRSVPSL